MVLNGTRSKVRDWGELTSQGLSSRAQILLVDPCMQVKVRCTSVVCWMASDQTLRQHIQSLIGNLDTDLLLNNSRRASMATDERRTCALDRG